VSIKALGTFTDCDVPCAAYRLEPGADFIAENRGVYMVLSGGGSLAGETFRRYTSLYIDTGETAHFKADQVSEILLMGMPNVADMQQHGATEPHSEAAE
jgi:hypothetical protein